MRLALRYDMRAPDIGAPAPALYGASLEQCSWADHVGFETVYIAEHHACEDGYSPAPLIHAAAIAAGTRSITLHFSALVAVLHNPVQLAEEIAVLDILSGGRVALTLGLGYRLHEYKIFGVEKRRRVAILEETIQILQKAWTGEPFTYRDIDIVVRPRPVQRPGPPLYIGGSTEASAVRAAKLGDWFLPATPDLYDRYAAERHALGLEVPPRPPRPGPLFLHVSHDPEATWAKVAPHLIYTTNANAEWAKERGVGATPYPPASSIEDLKASPIFEVVTPDECVALARDLGPDSELTFQPLMGGLDPAIGWESLELFEKEVLPRLVDEGLR